MCICSIATQTKCPIQMLIKGINSIKAKAEAKFWLTLPTSAAVWFCLLRTRQPSKSPVGLSNRRHPLTKVKLTVLLINEKSGGLINEITEIKVV